MFHYIVPAREGSKGFPNKNRKLVPIIKEKFPRRVLSRIIVTTDDPKIQEFVRESRMKLVERPKELAQDETSIKPVIEHVFSKFDFYDNDDIVLLYPTYPEREYKRDVRSILGFYKKNQASSLLCLQPPTEDTYSHLMMRLDSDTMKARHVFPSERGKFRRQEAKGKLKDLDFEIHSGENVYEYSHFVSVFRVDELDSLNKNLYNKDTIYYRLNNRVIDVDTKEDWRQYQEKVND
jgi:CMP-N-acetylneuraminic acid synthetase